MPAERETESDAAALATGSIAAFEKVFRAWKDPVYGYVLRMVGDQALAQDLTQDVFLRVMRSARTYDHRGRLRQWLFTIASNIVTDHLRRTKRRREVLVEEPADAGAAAGQEAPAVQALEAFSSEELRESVREAVGELPPEQRSVLLLRQYGDLTFKEIAALETCSINTALSRMRYALANLKKLLARKFEEAGDEMQRS
jgi:RNA polymerase sigma-70 factor (ECF subfamily)